MGKPPKESHENEELEESPENEELDGRNLKKDIEFKEIT